MSLDQPKYIRRACWPREELEKENRYIGGTIARQGETMESVLSSPRSWTHRCCLLTCRISIDSGRALYLRSWPLHLGIWPRIDHRLWFPCQVALLWPDSILGLFPRLRQCRFWASVSERDLHSPTRNQWSLQAYSRRSPIPWIMAFCSATR